VAESATEIGVECVHCGRRNSDADDLVEGICEDCLNDDTEE
jgi:NMD protein affecting ribosome stability and mRNA decay